MGALRGSAGGGFGLPEGFVVLDVQAKEVTTCVGRTGVVGLLEGDRPGPTVLLRSSSSFHRRKKELNFPHHHLRFDFDERAMVVGADLTARAATDYVMN